MRINPRITIPILAALLGALVGGIGVGSLALKRAVDGNELRSRLSVLERTRLLQQLQSSKNQQAITEQEILLAGDISSLGALLRTRKAHDEGSKYALKKVADYLVKYPTAFQFRDLRKGVDQALDSVK